MARPKTASGSRAPDGDNGPARSLKHHASTAFSASPLPGTANGERKHLITPILPNIEQHLQTRPPPHIFFHI
ncbi:hypothetical protein EV182_004887 [Spiromyces aspiralis]|uniref:Uncharacterized protein n=1 Tax=Spiromyces aspiralis TaxID=68401 RepID=A0ACC1HNA9_9FUNG|nr:hypothetical protein EV182_004887 [Spiromyces aspiralis]